MVFLANLAFNFHSGIYITTTFLLVNVYLMQNMIKNPIEIPFSLFFHNIGLTLAQIFPQKTTPTLLFLVDFQWNMLGDTININNLCCNPAVLKKSW